MSIQLSWLNNFTTPAEFEDVRKQLYPKYPFTYQDDQGYPFIDKAIEVNHVDLIEYFFRDAPDLLNVSDKRGRTFLSKAIEKGPTESAQKLVELGADLYALSSSSETSEKVSLLILALIQDMTARYIFNTLTSFLFKNGYRVEVEKTDTLVETALSLSCEPKKMYPALREKGKKIFKQAFQDLCKDPIHRMLLIREILAHSDMHASTAEIVAKYLFPWEVERDYEKYLHDTGTSALASFMNLSPQDFESARAFFPLHTLTDEDDAGSTVLHYAVVNRAHDLIEYFVVEEPELLQRWNKEGITPLDVAINSLNSRDYISTAKLLLDLGADIHSTASSAGTSNISLLVKALSSDLRHSIPTEIDLPKRSFTYLLLERGYKVDLRQSAQLVDDSLFQLNVKRTCPTYQTRAAAIHAFIKMVFNKLYRDFA
jgi:ankyrin repeat protein